jgi:uncharacterized ferredoxin-like protein
LEKAAVKDVAEFMAVAARTAPKTRGIDVIEVVAVSDPHEKGALIAKMNKISAAEDRPSLARDAGSIATAPEIIIIGTRSNPAGLNCGYCGYKTCADLKKSPGVCAYNSVDLGIAAGSAVSVAAQFHVDNRLMYSIGRAALELGYFSKDVKQALGIPLSATGKNPFFDRK